MGLLAPQIGSSSSRLGPRAPDWGPDPQIGRVAGEVDQGAIWEPLGPLAIVVTDAKLALSIAM